MKSGGNRTSLSGSAAEWSTLTSSTSDVTRWDQYSSVHTQKCWWHWLIQVNKRGISEFLMRADPGRHPSTLKVLGMLSSTKTENCFELVLLSNLFKYLLNFYLHFSGKSFRRMLATLHQYMDVLCKNIRLIASLTRHEDLRDDAKCQVYSFLLDCQMFLDILAEHSPDVENIRNNLKFWERMDDYTPVKRPRKEMYSVLISR